MTGALFIFSSRRRKSINILAYDGRGFLLFQKRLSAGRFNGWPATGTEPTVGLDARRFRSCSGTDNSLTASLASPSVTLICLQFTPNCRRSRLQ